MLALIWISVLGRVCSGYKPFAFAFLPASVAGEVPTEGRGEHEGTEEESERGVGTDKPTPLPWHRHTGHRTPAADERIDNYATSHR